MVCENKAASWRSEHSRTLAFVGQLVLLFVVGLVYWVAARRLPWDWFAGLFVVGQVARTLLFHRRS